jgi:thiamine pyrophosphokinase
MAVEKWMDKVNASTSRDKNTASYPTAKTLIYGGFGGRFDQEMGCINALYVWGKKQSFKHISMALYGEETCAFVLPEMPKTNEVRIRFPNGDSTDWNGQTTVGEGPTCGLIPLGGRCETVYTTGLKWNLDGDMPLEFGGLVSSSNRVVDGVVTVQSSSPLIFTTEIVSKQHGL